MRLHIFFRTWKCSPGREAAAADTGTGTTPADCAGLGDQKPPRSERSWSPLEVPFPNPHCPRIPLRKFHFQGKSSVYRRENLFLKALIVLAIIGAISVKREIRQLFQIHGSVDTSGLQSNKALLLLALHSQTNGYKQQLSANPIEKQQPKGNTSPAPARPLTIIPSNSHNFTKTQAGPCTVSGRTGVQALPDSKGHSEP